MENTSRWYRILKDGYVVFVVKVSVETQYIVLIVRNGCKRSEVL